MGKKVVFLSCGTELSQAGAVVCAVAAELERQEPGRTALVTLSEPEGWRQILCGREVVDREEEKSGLTGLLFNFRYAKLDGERIRSCALPTRLPGTETFFGKGTETLKELSYLLTKQLPQVYDRTLYFVRREEAAAETVLREAEIGILMLPQNPWYWKAFFSDSFLPDEGRWIAVIVGCRAHSRYGAAYFRTVYAGSLRGCRVLGIPDSAGYLEAYYRGSWTEFLKQHRLCRRGEENDEFLRQIKRLAALVLETEKHREHGDTAGKL